MNLMTHSAARLSSGRTMPTPGYIILIRYVCSVIILLAPAAHAQEILSPGDVQSSGTAYRLFTHAGEPTIEVMVLGSDGADGIYGVGVDTELDQLLALAGGAALGSRPRSTRRSVTIRLFRTEGGERRLIYEAPLEQMLLEPEKYPKLQEQDVFVIETIERTGFSWRDALSVVTTLTSVGLLAERLIRR